jgi:hypothetical protein
MQAQDDHVYRGHERALGSSVFAQLGRDADQLNRGHGLQTLQDLKARGASFSVDKNFGH